MSGTHFSELHLGGSALSPSKHENRQSNDHPDTGTCSKHQRRTIDPISKENVEPSTIDADPFGEYLAKHLNTSRNSGLLAGGESNGQYFINTPNLNLFAQYIDCESVDEIPHGLDQFDELASVQERHPKSRMIFDISNRLGLRDDGSSKHPVVFGGSLGALGSITSLALINFPPLTNRDQITKCHCWQKDGKLGEGCLQIIVDWAVDILVHVYDKDRDVSEKLVRSCWGFVDITPIGGPGSWAYGPDTKSHYSKVAESVKEPSKAILTDLVKTLPNLESLVVFGALPFEYAIKEGWFSDHLINQPIDMCLFHPLQAKMHVMDMAQALAWANAISCSLAAAMGCAPIKITPDILMIFYLPANKDASTDEARKTNLLAGILRAGGCTDLAAGVTKMLRCQDKRSPDAAYVDYAVKGTLLLTGVSIPGNQCNLFRRCTEVVEEAIESKKDEATCDEWTEAQEEKLLEIKSVLSGCGLAWILLSLAIKGKSPEQCRNHARTARLNQISRRLEAGKELTKEEEEFLAKNEADRAKANEYGREWRSSNKARYEDIVRRLADLEEVSEGDIKFHAEYERKNDRKNERWNERYRDERGRYDDIVRRLAGLEEVSEGDIKFHADYECKNERKNERRRDEKARYDDIVRRLEAREEVSEGDIKFHAKYEADRAKAKEYGREWRSSNKARSEDIVRRLEAREEVSEGDIKFHAKYEADRVRHNELSYERSYKKRTSRLQAIAQRSSEYTKQAKKMWSGASETSHDENISKEKHWMDMWTKAKDTLKRLREELKTEMDEGVKAELTQDIEEHKKRKVEWAKLIFGSD